MVREEVKMIIHLYLPAQLIIPIGGLIIVALVRGLWFVR